MTQYNASDALDSQGTQCRPLSLRMRRNEFASGESKANRWRIIIMIFNASRHRENCKGEGKTILQMLPDDRFLGWHFTSPQVENIEVKIAMQRSPADGWKPKKMKLKSMFLWDDLQRLQMWDCKCRGHQMTDNHRTKYSSNWAPLTSTQGSSIFRPFGIFDNFQEIWPRETCPRALQCLGCRWWGRVFFIWC